jgi:RNA-directed DNA polymerase
VEKHTDAPWALLYVKRWLAAPLQRPDGTLQAREKGTPQGSSVSPVLANLFMHYAFDTRLDREYPTVEFERYADDAVVHCVTERQAREVLAAIGDRMAQVGLMLHPTKTKIVYCRDGKRRGEYAVTSFTFLGFTFRARAAKDRAGQMFTSFLPAVSKDALKKMSAEVRSWRLHLRTGHDFVGLARQINPVVRGWMQYYGAFYRTELSPPAAHQLLPDALGPQEVSEAEDLQEVPQAMEARHQGVAADVRPVEMGPLDLVMRMIGAR